MHPHDRVPGLQVCPGESCGATVLLVDAGYQPLALPVFREPEPHVDTEPVPHSTVKQKINPQPPRPCEWRLCGVMFTPTHPHQKYHLVECREAAKLEREGDRRPELVAVDQ